MTVNGRTESHQTQRRSQPFIARIDKLSGNQIHSNSFFRLWRTFLPSRDDTPLDSGKILTHLPDGETRLSQQRCDILRLSCPNLECNQPPLSQEIPGSRRQPTIGVEPVGTAIERAQRFEFRHLWIESADVPTRYIGRIGQNNIIFAANIL